MPDLIRHPKYRPYPMNVSGKSTFFSPYRKVVVDNNDVSCWSRIKSGMIRYPKYRPYPLDSGSSPGMTRFNSFIPVENNKGYSFLRIDATIYPATHVIFKRILFGLSLQIPSPNRPRCVYQSFLPYYFFVSSFFTPHPDRRIRMIRNWLYFLSDCMPFRGDLKLAESNQEYGKSGSSMNAGT